MPSTGTTGITGDGDGVILGITAGVGMTDGIHLSHTIPGHGAGDGMTHGTTDITVHTTDLTIGMTTAGTDLATITMATAPTTPAGVAATTGAV